MRLVLNIIWNKYRLSSSLLILLLLGTDLSFVIMHIVFKLTHSVGATSNYDLAIDRGYAEFFQYTKFLWIIILLGYIIKSTKYINYLPWIIIFTFFLCDDALLIHEKVGAYFTHNFDFDPPINLRRHDIGELVSHFIFGTILITILSFAYLHGNKRFKKLSKDLGLFILCYIFFGGFIDMVHIIFRLERVGFAIIEEGGEMVIISLILWYIYLHAINQGKSQFFLIDSIRNFRNL